MSVRRRQQVWFFVVGILSLALVLVSLVKNFGPLAPGAEKDVAPDASPDDEILRSSCARSKSCGDVDRRDWCSSVTRGSNVHALCFSACLTSGPTWMAECAWQAIHHLPEVCDGTFEPEVPESFPEDDDADDETTCDDYAACAGCRDDDGTCGLVLQHYAPRTPREAAIYALDRDLDAWCRSKGVEKTWTAAQAIDALTLQSTWQVDGLEPPLVLEEHFLYGNPPALSGVFLKQAYSFWRYALNSRRPAGRAVQATTRSYFDPAELLDALSQREVAQGAMVFVDVLYQAMDTDYSLKDLQDAGVDRDVVLRQGSLPLSDLSTTVDPKEHLDFICVYQHTPSILRRSKLLRSLLAYERPLVLVLAGDFDCRLRHLPETHHTLIFPNDGACATQVDGQSRRIWWPEGLEGLDRIRDGGPAQSAGGLAGDALDATEALGLASKDRPYLLNCAFSVTPRKPSRVSLLRYLESDGGDRLRQLAQLTGKRVKLIASVSRIGTEPPRTYKLDTADDDQDGDAVFVLAPAGDTWSSGRVLEALLQGSIPVVDATYETDASSAKGCSDPAKFWREGDANFPRPAPFVFVDQWNDLPTALLDAGALDRARLDERLKAVAAYRQDLLVYLRTTTLAAVMRAQHDPPSTTCAAVLNNASTTADLVAQAAAYYGDAAWFDDFPDSPTYPGSGCTTKYYTDGRKTHGALCFDAQCAPPTVHAFNCKSARPGVD